MRDDNKALDSLLTKLGKPTTAQAEAQRRRSKRIEWAIVAGFALGLGLALLDMKVGIGILLAACVGYVVHSRDREGSFLSLLFLMAAAVVLLSIIGYVFGIPGLTSSSGGPSGMTGGWQY